MNSTKQLNADESGSNTVIELDESELAQVAGGADVVTVTYGAVNVVAKVVSAVCGGFAGVSIALSTE